MEYKIQHKFIRRA